MDVCIYWRSWIPFLNKTYSLNNYILFVFLGVGKSSYVVFPFSIFFNSSFDAKFQTGTSLFVNSTWKNPSGEWHVGCKLIYELFTYTLTSRLKVFIVIKDIWLVYFYCIKSFNSVFLFFMTESQEEIAKALKNLDNFDQVMKFVFANVLGRTHFSSGRWMSASLYCCCC